MFFIRILAFGLLLFLAVLFLKFILMTAINLLFFIDVLPATILSIGVFFKFLLIFLIGTFLVLKGLFPNIKKRKKP
jgi:hypothetical protein